MPVINRRLNAEATRLKEEGTSLFKAGKFEEAVSVYSKSLVIEETVDVLNNRSFAYLKLQNWNCALRDSTAVLDRDKSHFKACYRKTLAELELKHFNEALATASFCSKIDPPGVYVGKQLHATAIQAVNTQRQPDNNGLQFDILRIDASLKKFELVQVDPADSENQKHLRVRNWDVLRQKLANYHDQFISVEVHGDVLNRQIIDVFHSLGSNCFLDSIFMLNDFDVTNTPEPLLRLFFGSWLKPRICIFNNIKSSGDVFSTALSTYEALQNARTIHVQEGSLSGQSHFKVKMEAIVKWLHNGKGLLKEFHVDESFLDIEPKELMEKLNLKFLSDKKKAMYELRITRLKQQIPAHVIEARIKLLEMEQPREKSYNPITNERWTGKLILNYKWTSSDKPVYVDAEMKICRGP